MNTRELHVLGRTPEKLDWVPMILTDLKSMQAYLGGNIERIELIKGIDMWVNEEFLFYDNKVNVLLRYENDSEYSQVVFGNIFLSATDEGEFASLSDEQVNWVINNTEIIKISNQLDPAFRLDLREGGL